MYIVSRWTIPHQVDNNKFSEVSPCIKSHTQPSLASVCTVYTHILSFHARQITFCHAKVCAGNAWIVDERIKINKLRIIFQQSVFSWFFPAQQLSLLRLLLPVELRKHSWKKWQLWLDRARSRNIGKTFSAICVFSDCLFHMLFYSVSGKMGGRDEIRIAEEEEHDEN